MAHRTALLRTGTARATVSAGADGKRWLSTGKLRRTTHTLLLLLLRRHGLRSRYGGGHRSPALLLLGRRLLPILRFRWLSHPALLLILSSGTCGCGQLGPQVLVLPEQTRQFGFDLIEESVDLVLVIAFTETDGRELLVPHVLGGQWHLFTST